jgi:hypothetical protein
MSAEHIGLLKSLVLRPSHQLAPSVQPLVEAMVEAGCVSYGVSGWAATARGCAMIAEERARQMP